MVQPCNLVCLQLEFSSLLLKYSFNVTLLVFERFNGLLFDLDISLCFNAALDSGLDLKAVLLEKSKLLHQNVLLLDHLLIVLSQLFGVFAAHLQLGLELTHFLSEFVPLELTTS